MLDHLRQKAIAMVSSVSTVLVSTYGPAGIQAGNFPCEANGLELFVLIPRTSELLFNIENHPEVIVTASEWHLHGVAFIVPGERAADEQVILHLLKVAEGDWSEVVEIRPTRLQIHPGDPTLPRETIDIQQLPPE